MNLFDLFRRFKSGIILATLLVVIENVAWIAEPALFGNVIDALIDKATSETPVSYMMPLLIWIGTFLLNSGVGALRRALDPRIFLRMFIEIATDVARSAKEKGHSVSKTAARAELSREFITFAEYQDSGRNRTDDFNRRSSVCPSFFDWRIALSCLFIVLPLLLISRVYNKRVFTLQKDLHDNREEAYECIFNQKPPKRSMRITTQSHVEQRIANWGAFNFGAMRIFLLLIFLVVLYIAIDLDDFSTGNIYSIVAYLWTFVTRPSTCPN